MLNVREDDEMKYPLISWTVCSNRTRPKSRDIATRRIMKVSG